MLKQFGFVAGVFVWVLTANVSAAEKGREEYLADLQHRFLHSQQGFGQLGMNTCAHAPEQPAAPLIVNGKKYARGLGHHAVGDIVVDLAGEYSRFDCLVGVQTQTVREGSVVFKVLVDGEVKFDSGVMKQDSPAREVSVDVEGKEELRLSVTDADDGVVCDCANWLEARLTRSLRPVKLPATEFLDVAPFAEVVTSDPARMDGSKANRIQEYREEDVYMETPVQPDGNGAYGVAPSDGKPGCIGLKWFERRRIRLVGFELAGTAPADLKPEVQCWGGESAWQGGWKPLAGEWQSEGERRNFVPDWSSVPEARGGSRKIRFLLPTQVAIKKFIAMAPTPLAETGLLVQLEKPLGEGQASIEIYNGAFVGTNDPLHVALPQDQPTTLKVRYSKPRPLMADVTVLRFQLPGVAFGVAVDDVLKNGCVYVRDFGLFVTQDPPKMSLAEYKQQIASQQTILQEVHSRPDQTFAQATEKVHNPAQNMQPTLLSLACDNHKVILHRSGELAFSASPETDDKHVHDMLDQSGRITPKLGSGKNEKFSRTLDGGWMPIIVNTVEENGLRYRQRTFVAPIGKERPGSVGVMEFSIENLAATPADASLELAIWANGPKDDVAELSAVPTGAIAFRRGRLVASLNNVDAKPLKMDIQPAGIRFTGQLQPRVTSRVVVFVPLAVAKPEQHTEFKNADELLRATREYWSQQLAGAMQVEIPDTLLANVIKASQVHCLIAARSEENRSRVAPWIGSVAYGPLESESHSIIRAMDFFGHHEFARKGLDFFISRYKPEGFLTTGYTIMGTGWHLWSLGEHYGLARDKAWLQKVAPEVTRVCNWIVKQREKTMKTRADGTKPPEYGLMPPGIMADWNAFAYYFCSNGYFCTGLRAAAEALADVGVAESAGWKKTASEFQTDILRAYSWTRARMPVYRLRDGTSVPGYPSQLHGPGPTANFFPGEDANRSWCYDIELGSHHLVPFGILDPTSREATWMLNHMEDVQFLSSGWFDYPAERSATDPYNFGGFAKVQPYYCRNGEINAMRDDVKAFVRTYFNTIPSLLNYENLSFQEHFGGVAAWNKTHETGYFLHQTRLMLVMERGDDLWLAPFVTTNWMTDGLVVAATNAPTRFGPVSYRMTSAVGQGRIDVTIDPPTRTSPRQIVVRLRHPEGKPITKVTVNDQPHKDFDAAAGLIRISPSGGKIRLWASY